MPVAKPRVTAGDKSRDTPFATAVRTLRFSLKWSQEQLADKLEVDRVTVARWEGARAEPEPRTRRLLAQIAQEHGIAVSDGLGIDTQAIRNELVHSAPTTTPGSLESQLLDQIRHLSDDRRVELLVQLARENALAGK
jgi:transcriptional regulator with XRE-family HTH domain